LPVTIDFVDFYNVPAPYARPANYLSVADYGADPTGARDSVDAFFGAIGAAKEQNKGVWIPAGKYSFKQNLGADKVTVRGAGPWYTELHGNNFGIYGARPSTNVGLYDFAIFGRTRFRVDSELSTGIAGSYSNSVVQNIWIEHNKVGVWVDGPLNSLLITGLTVRNTFADGINLHQQITNTVVEQSNVRNTGDDNLAMWADAPGEYSKNTFRFNTLQLPMLANTIGIYGGADNAANDNVCADTVVEGAGLFVGQRYGSVALGGTTTFARNTLIRCGSGSATDTTFRGWGAVVLYSDNPITTPVLYSDTTISDSYFQAISFWQPSFQNINFNNINIDSASVAFEERSGGSMYAANVVARNITVAGQLNCNVPFTVTQGNGNSGWASVKCI